MIDNSKMIILVDYNALLIGNQVTYMLISHFKIIQCFGQLIMKIKNKQTVFSLVFAMIINLWKI